MQAVPLAAHRNEPHKRFDPASASLVAATEEEALACLNGEVTAIDWDGTGAPRSSQAAPIFLTPRFAAYNGTAQFPTRTYRFVPQATDQPAVETTPRQYLHVFGVPGQDAVVLSYARGAEWRHVRFDLDTQAETVLFATNRVADAMAVWRNYLFLAMGRDLLSYDLATNRVVHFEKDFVREGLQPVCEGCGDGNGIRALRLDGDRLLVLPLRGVNARLIDLPAYAANFGSGDFFIDLLR